MAARHLLRVACLAPAARSTFRAFSSLSTPSTTLSKGLRAHVVPRVSLAAWRHMSTSADSGKENEVVLYEGPLAKTLGRLKKVSLTSCTLTCIFVPLSVYAGNPSMPLASKIAVAATVGFFGLLTTGVLHRVSKAYVCKLSINQTDAALFEHPESSPAPDATSPTTRKMEEADVTITAETLNLFGLRKNVTFRSSDIKYPNGPGAFVSFYVNGQAFFVHPELVRADGRLLGIFRGIV
eukprot:m.36534 g.36534  ORF g.36534 m.36534 type:complete len:237 (+) comp9691_c0_seq1:71-781(+)